MTLDKRFKMWYHMTTNKAVGGHLMFKKVFILCLVCLLVVGGLCACQNGNGADGDTEQNATSEFFGDKDEIYYVSYTEHDGVFSGRVFIHNLGDLNKLPVGKHEVIEVIVTNGNVQYIHPGTITIEYSPKQIGVFSFSNTEYEKEGFTYNAALNDPPPEKLKALIEDFIKTH